MTEDEMVGWYHRLNGHKFEQAPGDGEGQGSLACYSPWRHKESQGADTGHLSCSVQFSCSVVSDSLRPHGLQHARSPCPLLSPRVCRSSCPWSWWCHPTISSSVIPFSLRLQSFLASQSFPVVSSLHQVAKVLELHSASASVLPMNSQD